MVQLVDLLIDSTDITRRQLAELYCRIWLEPPWCESDWTVEKVLSDLDRELQLPGAIGYVAVDPHVVGFTWGYQVVKEELRAISGNEMLDYLFVGEGGVFYIDELGVDGNSRKSGVGAMLTGVLLKRVWDQGYQQVVLRTDDQAVAAITLYKRLGFADQPFRDVAYPTRRYWVLEKK